MISFANQILGVLAVAGQIAIIGFLLILILSKQTNKPREFFGKRAIIFSFILVFAATLGSLFYSEIAGFEPCKLCWIQRIFMYPQVIILGIALWKKDYFVGKYILSLSFLGALTAGYQYLLQFDVVPDLPCSAVESVSCAQRFVVEFGYITIPLMSFTVFAMVILLFILQKQSKIIK